MEWRVPKKEKLTSKEFDDEFSVDTIETLNHPVEPDTTNTPALITEATELPAAPQASAQDISWSINSSNIVDKPRRSRLLLNLIHYFYKRTMTHSGLLPIKYRDNHFRFGKDVLLTAHQLELGK